MSMAASQQKKNIFHEVQVNGLDMLMLDPTNTNMCSCVILIKI